MNKFNIICNEVNIMDNVVKYDEMVSSIPLEEGIFAGFDLGSFGGIIAVGGEVWRIASALDDGSERRADFLGQQSGEIDTVEVSVILYIRHS